ncbi:hypothetical protein [Yoonia sp. BS5-3]|uniref:Uncharacterized protein n=1 Tax=Yoonia phaeophyticola TaxID=3137369 RepID=A0ABZ2V7V2_9RHOB
MHRQTPKAHCLQEYMNMGSTQAKPCCRCPSDKEIWRSEADLDFCEETLLTLARLYFESFARPESTCWINSLMLAQAHFGPDAGPVIGVRLLNALQAMRFARHSIFSFNSVECPTCSAVLTEHERRLMAVIKATRTGQSGKAQTELMMLCEGADITNPMIAFCDLAAALAEEESQWQGDAHETALF